MTIPSSFDRRRFLEFMGKSSLAVAGGGLLSSCITPPSLPKAEAAEGGLQSKAVSARLTGIPPTRVDDLILHSGLRHDVVATWGDRLNSRGDTFGFNNDFLGFLPLPGRGPHEALLFVNHETADPLFVSGYNGSGRRTRSQVIAEQKNVGVSIIKIARGDDSVWRLGVDDEYNRRISGVTPIPFAGGQKLVGTSSAVGTLGNCAGGKTPWGTFLTCEENYSDCYGEISFESDGRRGKLSPSRYGWEQFFRYPPEHYGWVVEINPLTGEAKKHTALGRFAHEGAAVTMTEGGLCVVYMGDDADNECFYKFIADRPYSLESGTLYVARVEEGRWIPLSVDDNADLKRKFNTQLRLLTRTREAARMVGGTRLNRPEGAVFDQTQGAAFVSCTNNYAGGDNYGRIAKFQEKNRDPRSLEFTYSDLAVGGPNHGFACPDNLALDRRGNMWFTSDISEYKIREPAYEKFGNNGLYYLPLSGPQAGKVFQIASAPNDAELTGPCFSEDGTTLFLSVQHPGAMTRDIKRPTSKWSTKNDGVPRPAVVAISGPLLDQLLG